jgi:hypothetical protein
VDSSLVAAGRSGRAAIRLEEQPENDDDQDDRDQKPDHVGASIYPVVWALPWEPKRDCRFTGPCRRRASMVLALPAGGGV